MKKILALSLSLLLACGAFFACGKKNSGNNTDERNQSMASDETPSNDVNEDKESIVYDNKDEEIPPHVPETESSEGLAFEVTPDGKGCVLTGKGSCKAISVVVDGYNGLPVVAIAPSALKDFTTLQSISLGNGIKSIGVDAFSGCTSLMKISFSSSLKSIGEGAFRGCTSLSSVSFGSGLESIGAWAFSNCSALSGITVPNGVKEIGSSAFYSCENLVNINLSGTVTKLGSSVFFDTGYYNDSKNWSETVLYVGDCLIEAKKSIEGEYQALSKTRVVADGAFYACDALTKISLPSNLTYIGDYAFYSCSALTEVALYDTILAIGTSAFAGCSAITTVSLVESGDADNSENTSMTREEIEKAIKPQA